MEITSEIASGFESLCNEIGLAVLMAQKVQFSLACYYAVSVGEAKNWDRAKRSAAVDLYLNKPLGAVIADIKKDAPLSSELELKTDHFRDARNWLVHDFDQEATPSLARGQRFEEYAQRMRGITEAAFDLMRALDAVGNELVPLVRDGA